MRGQPPQHVRLPCVPSRSSVLPNDRSCLATTPYPTNSSRFCGDCVENDDEEFVFRAIERTSSRRRDVHMTIAAGGPSRERPSPRDRAPQPFGALLHFHLCGRRELTEEKRQLRD